MTKVEIVGGGLAGLIAAIHVAESGGSVRLHEASRRLGGRARTDGGPYAANIGPHALYRHGEFERWLEDRKLMPAVTAPRLTGFRIVCGGRKRRLPPRALLPALRHHGETAPVEMSFRSWARERFGDRAAEAAIGFGSLPTFHSDPGELSAAFVQRCIHRSALRGAVYYVVGGWANLVDGLAQRARELGVEIETGSKLSSLPDGPTIIATDLPAAARLLNEPDLSWPGPRTAMLDVALRRRRGDDVSVLDLDERIYASNYSTRDPSVAPSGEVLVQACAGIRSNESLDDALERIRRHLDRGFRDWRDRTTWQRQGLMDGGASPADPPGSDWRDRPAIERGEDRWLVGDKVAAPGILSEVAFASARAAAAAVQKRLGRLRAA